jgi:polyisoprenoid-binding protein YceI
MDAAHKPRIHKEEDLVTTSAARSDQTVKLEPSTWTLDPAHANVEFAVKHLMITTVRGRFGKVDGTVKVDPARPDQLDVSVEIDPTSVDTREERRDAHLRSPDFFDAERYPRIIFKGGRVEGDLLGRFKLYGELTIRGITRPVVLDVSNDGQVKDPWGNDKLGITATAKVNRLEWNLKWNMPLETGGFLVGDEVRITIEAEFARQS